MTWTSKCASISVAKSAIKADIGRSWAVEEVMDVSMSERAVKAEG